MSNDAETLALHLSQFPGQVRPPTSGNLPKYTANARLLVDGLPSRPFSMRTLPAPEISKDEDRSAIVRATSNRRYARQSAIMHKGISKALKTA